MRLAIAIVSFCLYVGVNHRLLRLIEKYRKEPMTKTEKFFCLAAGLPILLAECGWLTIRLLAAGLRGWQRGTMKCAVPKEAKDLAKK
ncbi:MAG: hypothetical protein HY220_00290 [Candidatus Sungbacteria bacterium]|uniref:Uncharacterized protein n=1 Tax=Candidatus Sungiibacteriota bacterium TaxID=2750080 RepID=A0A9D6QY84_9BACT|nr:hypothetical protein [Candidatus Sungbacteria bacterium]